LTDVQSELVSSYVGVCPGCGAGREFLFGLPDAEAAPGAFPDFGGPEASEILDAGQWLEIADRAAADDGVDADRRLALARAAVEEVVKFIPLGEHVVPDDAFWTDEGLRVRAEEPGRFRLERLLVVRDSYSLGDS
jgi:hypothetical protein